MLLSYGSLSLLLSSLAVFKFRRCDRYMQRVKLKTSELREFEMKSYKY